MKMRFVFGARIMMQSECRTVTALQSTATQSADALMTCYKEPNSCSQGSYRIFGTFYLFMFTDCVCQEINRDRIPLWSRLEHSPSWLSYIADYDYDETHSSVRETNTISLEHVYVHVHFTDSERVDMVEYETCQYITPTTHTKRQRHVTYNNVTTINYQ